MAHEFGFGIDVGGSGIKGAQVDIDTGDFVGDRLIVDTPSPATPDAVASTIASMVESAGWDGPVGVTLPSVIRNQVALSAANIDPTWIGTNTTDLFTEYLPGREVSVLNDADAAGLAEVAFGDPNARRGSVLFLTFGTGIGSAFLLNGVLFPNTEIGHLHVGDREAEHIASSAVKTREGLSYEEWAERVEVILREYEHLFNPTAFVVGGGISADHARWLHLINIRTPLFPARLRNRAGIVGAAMAANNHLNP